MHDVEVVKVVPQEHAQQRAPECISERNNERTIGVKVPQLVEDIVEVVKLFLQERVQQHAAEHVVDVPPQQITEETIGVMKVVRPERASKNAKLIPQDKVQTCTLKQIVALRIREENGKVTPAHSASPSLRSRR